MKNNIKLGIITSRGGHLYQIYKLKPWWKKYQRFWVVPNGTEVVSILAGEKICFAYGPETRNIFNAIKNLMMAIRVLIIERPTVLISCGAGIAPPFYLIGKLLGTRLIFIETYDLDDHPSLTARMVYPIVDYFFVQREEDCVMFGSKAKYFGSVLCL